MSATNKVAKWIKDYGQELDIVAKSINNPVSKINYVKSLPFFKFLLEKELENHLSVPKEDYDYYERLSSMYEMLEMYKEAFQAINKALKFKGLTPKIIVSCSLQDYNNIILSADEETKEAIVSSHRLGMTLYNKLPISVSTSLGIVRSVKRKSVTNIFNLDSKTYPLIFTNLNFPSWDLKYIEKVAGNTNVTLKKQLPYSFEWAQLESSTTCTLRNFIFSLSSSSSTNSEMVFDWSLPLFCPLLNKEFKIPFLFTKDYLKETSDDSLYRHSWPSLFIGKNGTGSGLHIDAFGSHFWMVLMCGRKKWTLFPPSSTRELRPHYSSLDPTFLLQNWSHLDRYEVILEAGETLFVPSGWPHIVQNVETSIAVSGNFVDESNIAEVKKHLRVNGCLDSRAADLVNELELLTK